MKNIEGKETNPSFHTHTPKKKQSIDETNEFNQFS